MESEINYSSRIVGTPVWTNRGNVCSVSDDDRHLGRIVHARGWHAFDATKMNDTGDGFRYIGAFRTKHEAMNTVLDSVRTAERPLALAAGMVFQYDL